MDTRDLMTPDDYPYDSSLQQAAEVMRDRPISNAEPDG